MVKGSFSRTQPVSLMGTSFTPCMRSRLDEQPSTPGKRVSVSCCEPNSRNTMQHQRAAVMTDETIIDQGEREQLEVNSATAGKSLFLFAERAAAITKQLKIPSPTIGYHNMDNPALPNCPEALLLCSGCCPAALLACTWSRGALCCGLLLRRGRAPARLRALPCSGAAQCWEPGLAGHCCSGDAASACSASPLARCAVGMSRDVRVNWQL